MALKDQHKKIKFAQSNKLYTSLRKEDENIVYTRRKGERPILVDASLIDSRQLVLNYSDTFVCFDRWGDICPRLNKVQGLFDQGCRYLSQLEIMVDDARPDYLSSTVHKDNCVLRADLTNPAFFSKKNQCYQPGMIYFNRIKFILKGILYERISMISFVGEVLILPIKIILDADFKDIFELRGAKRISKSGVINKSYNKQNTIEFVYYGQDKVTRYTTITFSRKFDQCLPDNSCLFFFELQPKVLQAIEFTVDLNPVTHSKLSLGKALYSLENQIRHKKKRLSTIKTSNEQFNSWIGRSQSDIIALLSPRGDYFYPLAGIPWYNTIFGRDGLITGLQTLLIAPYIARDVLLYLAEHQSQVVDDKADAEPGKILHEIRKGELVNLGEVPFKEYYGSIDATPLFICLAGGYLKRTNDLITIKKIWPNIKKALTWIDAYGDSDGDGFVEYQKKCANGLDNQGWKDSHDSVFHFDGQLAEGPIALCEVQAYVYQAKISGAMLACALNEPTYAEGLKYQAKVLKTQFNDKFWDNGLNTYVLALDKEKQPCRVLSSNAGHCLFSGIIDEDKIERLVKQLFSDNLFSGWGIRTISRSEKLYNPMSYHNGSIWPHDNSLIAFGLSRCGYTNKVGELLKALFDASLFFELQRIPELFCGFKRRAGEGPALYPVACSPQAWASGSIFIFLQSMCGIEINAQDKHIIFNKPVLPDFLDHILFRDIVINEKQVLSFRLVRFLDDVGVEIIEKPTGWLLSINK